MDKALITLTIADSDADTSLVSVFVSVGVGDTVESLASDYAQIFWGFVMPLIDGILVKVSITLEPDISAWDNNIVDILSDVEEKAVFTLRVCGSHRPVKLSLPTFKEEIFEGMGKNRLVDETNGDYQAFKYALANGVVDGGIAMTDSHGADICEVLYGEQFFGKG